MHTRALASLSFAVAALAAAVPGSASAAIQVANAKPLSGVEGGQVDHQRVVTFDDVGACAASAYTVTIAWGDGTTSDGSIGKALKASPALCTYDTEGSHRYERAGTDAVTATICQGAECVSTPVPGTASIEADDSLRADPAPEGHPAAAPAAAAQQQPGPVAQPVVAPTSPSLTVLGPVRRSQLAATGLRVRLSPSGGVAHQFT